MGIIAWIALGLRAGLSGSGRTRRRAGWSHP
jgi:hypothetical protein